MENLLNDHRKFEKLTLKKDAFLNFLVNQEKHMHIIFKNLIDSNSMSKNMEVYETSWVNFRYYVWTLHST